MAKKAPSVALRAQLRARIINRIAELNVKDFEAAEELGLSPGQMSRLRAQEDVFTLDRLIDAAANIGITVRMSATRPYRQG
jgi:predicted XRE-type DNA-binding protein